MFSIEIKQVKRVVEKRGKEWEILSEKDGEINRGYTPEIEKEVELTQTIYTQAVSELDLVRVINAVNTPLPPKVRKVD